ncbi:MAG: hypothetical protein ACLQVY_12545 [Limisphaerales bacterium]
MKTRKTLFGILTITTVLAMNGRSQIVTVPIDTGTAAWTVTGGGATQVSPYVLSGFAFGSPTGPNVYEPALSVTSTGSSTGTFLPGGSLANFDGFWLADFTFYLPPNATDVSLNFANFYVDDRAVLTLNDSIFAAVGTMGGSSGPMVFTDGGPLVPYSSFNSSVDGFVSGTVTSGFNIGGENTIEAIINNTDQGVNGPDINISALDGTSFALSGAVSYSTAAVPEPTTIFSGALMLLPFGSRAVRILRKRQSA